jgi:hypothetical protein
MARGSIHRCLAMMGARWDQRRSSPWA